ncbi:hypothetical protein [Tolypothrix sp. VBCCA 56010]|uniref:hypothetical protein n=1 Tax=Tolypothrix sp. VBCCA 56010 TaxID=3137731 RepID=UPI003D7DCD87
MSFINHHPQDWHTDWVHLWKPREVLVKGGTIPVIGEMYIALQNNARSAKTGLAF